MSKLIYFPKRSDNNCLKMVVMAAILNFISVQILFRTNCRSYM